MISIKTNCNVFVKTKTDKCISQVIAVSEQGGFRLFVAWQREFEAKHGVFSFFKSKSLYQEINQNNIEETADSGIDIGGTGEEEKVFSILFYKKK